MSTVRSHSLLQSYGIRGMLRLLADGFATKLTLSNARLLRRPFYIRGKRWMAIGDGFTTGPGLRMEAFPRDPNAGPVLTIGRDVRLNDYVHIGAVSSVTIGDRVLIASKVFITDHNHGTYQGPPPHESPLVPPEQRPLSYAPVRIEDDVWIGEFVSILPGVTIGKGAVIGTMSTVTRDVPPYTIAVGSPARPIKRYNFETSAWELL
jgi:acetyltransferase-like isoleucine patch superfamily enzyme